MATDQTSIAQQTSVRRKSDLELLAMRSFNAPVQNVFAAWTKPELFRQWWAPKSMGMALLSCEQDVRAGGQYRITFGHPETSQPIAFFGNYVDVVPNARIVWTNEESEDGAVTTVTFEERAGKTHVVMEERYPAKQACDQGFEAMESCLPEQFAQLDSLLEAGRT